MSMTFDEIMEEELANKRVFEANWTTVCDMCDETIEVGEEFIFMGDKRKICTRCQEENI